MSPPIADTPIASPPRHWGRKLLILLGVLLAFTLLATSFVMVDESEFVIIERLGKLVAVYDREEDRGLHFKLPWPIDVERKFDRRIQLLDPPGREIFTSDKKNITVDAFLCWKIGAPSANEETALEDRPVVRFFRAFGSTEIAETRLNSRMRSILTSRIGQVELSELLQVSGSEDQPVPGAQSLLDAIARDIQREVLGGNSEEPSLTQRTGIEIVDVRVKRINLPIGNHAAVFERMRSERQKIAEGYRSAGLAENQMIRSQADRRYQEILSQAIAEGEQIKGSAEAEAVAILNEAYGADPEFYKTMRTLDVYRQLLGEETTLVLSARSPLLKLLTSGIPETSPAPEPAPTVSPETGP